ncbi:DUF937 domain-containing protein [uncultured Deinococcus sp.]|uniref:DUF937 domain-containing protein n=1 Tax=uncultured Deinococcus sp. TaxID=158789 RepID=UPI0025EED3FD|nr:DUF937 domain-containing protein [uncultured Deinococcus sp.]
MNVMDLIQSFFDGEGSARLGQVVGLDAQTAQRALGAGLPMQLDALADHATTAQGQSQIVEAIQNLPDFGSVHDALAGTDGAANLQRAGELLGPALLGSRADTITAAVAAQAGAPAGGVGRLMQMALPLLLSLLGNRAGVNAGNIGAVMGGLKGGLGGLLGAGGAGVAAAAHTGASHIATPHVDVPSVAPTPDAGPLSADGLLAFVRGQFSGPAAEKIGAAAGFGGSTASRATQAALPLILGALVSKARTGGGDILGMARPFAGLSDDGGHLNLQALNDPAELGRVEGQGRGLLGSLFGNVDELTGRLGTALGGSGSNAGRLLALLTPLVLSVLGGRARAGNLDAGGLGGLLGGLGGQLSGLLPAGLGSLGALLGAGGLAAASAGGAVPAAPVVAPAPVSLGTSGASRPAGAVPPAAPTVTPMAATPAAPARRGGFPLWLLPLLAVLLLGGCWLLNRQPAAGNTATGAANPATGTTDATGTDATGTATGSTDTAGTDTTGTDASGADTTGTDTTSGTETAGAADPAASGTAGGFAISEPAADATLPAGGFTMRGTGTAGETLQILEDGTSLGNVTVGEDGTWSLEVPSPVAGAHTYSVQGANGTELGTLAATIGAADANASAANCTDEYSLSITDGQTVSEPFRFGGKGQGQGYSVTVKRGDRTIGVKDIPLDSTCGWSYQSKPGAGAVSYEVRPLGDASAAPLSSVSITVNQ